MTSTWSSDSHSSLTTNGGSETSSTAAQVQTVAVSYFSPPPVRGEPIANLVRAIESDEGGADRLQRARQRLSARLALTNRGIRTLRLNAGLSQSQLAEKTGLTQPQIATFERGQGNPTVATLRRIAEVLGVRASELAAQWDHVTKVEE